MGENKRCLLLLLGIFTLSKTQDAGDSEACLMDKIYKSFHKYEYLYETESLNALNGAVNGPKASCKVEVKVPGPCSYIVHTTECTLSEVVDVTADGKPVFRPAAGTETFKAAMEKHPLKFTVEKDNDIKLFPEEDELVNILNVKRGIISALAVPVLEEEKKKEMHTIYGLCKTDYTVNSKENIVTNITLNRDLSKCDKFRPVKDHTSPLALITGMHYPLAQLIRTTQTCNYKFDNEKHYMTSGVCTEKHLLVPFSHKAEFGVANFGKQATTLLGVTKYNDRIFNHNVANMKPLHPDSSVDMSPIQDKEAALAVMRELAQLSKSSYGHKRAHLAHKLVSVIRKMNAETLTAAAPEALEISQALTYQALLQCGTPECNRAIMQVVRTFDRASVKIDTAVYAMGLVPHPSRVLVREMLEMAMLKPSRPIYYAVSNAVRRLYEAEGVTKEMQSVADHVLQQISDCTGDQEHIFLTLRVIGNMAVAMNAASSALKSAVIQCINQPVASPAVQRAAVQVFRQIPVPEEGRKVLMHVVLDRAAATQERVAAYLILMKDPQTTELIELEAALHAEENPQAKSFIISHITNILSSTTPETLELRQRILEAFQGNEVGTLMDPSKFSRFYKIGSLEGNMIFESPKELPRELMLEMTLNAFGYDMDLVEFGMEGKGFEPFVEALFGVNGFFPDTVMKTIFHAANKMPHQFNEVLNNVVPNLRNDKKKRQATQNILREISQNVKKLIEDLKVQDSPEALVYLRLLDAELGYLKTKDMEEMAYSAGNMIDNFLKMLPKDFIRGLFSSVDNELFLHYLFMDNEFYLPTGSGFPLRIALSGIFTPGIKGGLSFNPERGEFAFMPSVGIELVTEIGAHFPDYVQSGLEMHTNIYHESGLRAKLSMSKNQAKLTVPAPQEPTKIISVTNSLVSVLGGKSKSIPAMGKHIEMAECSRLFPGLKYCTALQYSDAMTNDAAPYFPLTGESKFAVELHATGEVRDYTAIISYDHEDEMDKVTVGLKAEGTSFEATAQLKLNRQMYSVSAEFLIPSLQVDSKVTANVVKRAEELTVELESDLKLPETSAIQKLIVKYDGKKIEAEVKSDVSSEIQNIISNSAVEAMVNSLLDYQIIHAKTKIRDILEKSAEGLNVPVMRVITLPKRLFLNVEAAVKYHFGEHYKTITFPLPLGGKSLKFMSKSTKEILIPESMSLSMPTCGMAEASAKLNSNFYNLEASVFAGRDPVAPASYSAKAEVTGTSSVDLLSLKVEGSALVKTTPGDSLKANVKTAVHHKLISFSISVVEEVKRTEKISVKSSSKLEVTSPVGVQISLEHTGQVGVNAEEISGDGNLEVSFKAGKAHGSGTLTQSVSLLPSRPESKIETSLKIDSTVQAQNTISAAFTNGQLSIQSNTAVFEDLLTNIAVLKESQLVLKSDTKSLAFGLKIQNTAEVIAGAEAASIKFEASADLSEERIHSQVTGALDTNGLTINSDASARLIGHTATHRANLTLNNDGLSSSGTTSLKSLLTLKELKQTFDISYKNLTTTAISKTTGSIMGMRMRHSTELEVAGLTGRLKYQMHLYSEAFRFDTTVRGTASPFRFNVDAAAGADGFINLYGMQRVQIHTKFLLKAEPFAITHSQECRVLTTHSLHNGVSIQSKLENKFNSLLTPVEQNGTLTVQCKVNNYAINQEISAYNNPERLGLEGSGTMTANQFNSANVNNQDFSVSAFLKYDKNCNGHGISLPFTASLPIALDDIQITLVNTGEALRNYINKENIASKIQNLPQFVNNFVSEHNFEERTVQLKHDLVALTQNMPEYVLTLEDLEDFLINLGAAIEILVNELANNFIEVSDILKQLMVKGTLIENVVEKLTYELNAFNEQYDISTLIFSVIEDVKSCVSIHTVKQLFIELDIIRNLNAIYSNVRAVLLKSKVGKKIEAVLDKIAEHIKQFKNDKTLHVWAHNLKLIKIQTTQLLDDTMTYLRTNDFNQVIKHLNETKFSAEHKLGIPPQIPGISLSFGKLYGEVRVNSPVYSIRTSAHFQNASEGHPLFTASVTSQGISVYDNKRNYNLDFTAQMSVPEMNHLIVSETLKLTGFLNFDQQASLTLNRFASQALPKQNPKTSTSPSTADFNTAYFSIDDVMYFSLETSYNHTMRIPGLLVGSDVTLSQKAVANQEAAVVTLQVKNEGTGKFLFYTFSDKGTHKSDLIFNMDLSTAKLAFIGHTECDTIKMKMTANVDVVAQSHINFNARIETESPIIKNSLVVASGKARLGDMKVEIKAAHDTELVKVFIGSLTNAVNIMACPSNVDIDFQNKGDIKISHERESVSAKVELQYDYSVTLNTELQQISTVALVCFNQYYYSHNFTVINNKAETGIYTVVNGLINPSFLKGPAIYVPVFDFEIPAVTDLMLFEQTGLWDTFTSTDQPIDLDAKLVYHRSSFAPIFSLGLIVSEMSFKSSLLKLNANAGIYQEEGFAMRVRATTASVFEGLKAKLDGTTSVAAKGGVKLSMSLSLDNVHIGGSHDSSLTLDIENFEAVMSMDTAAKINLPTFSVNTTHQLSADTKTHPKSTSALKIKYSFDRSDSKGAGYGDAENNLKLEATAALISIESVTKTITNSIFSNDVMVQGTLDNEATISVKADGLQSNLKTTGNGIIGDNRVKVGYDINDTLTFKGDLSHVFSVLQIDSNYEINEGKKQNMKINHTALGKTDIVPLSALMSAVEMILSNPQYYDFEVKDSETNWLHQGIKHKSKSVSRWYNSSIAVLAETSGDVPEVKLVFEGTYNLTSPSALLEYEFDIKGLVTSP